MPSQSNFNFDLTMSGRGCPIPSHYTEGHSLFSTVRSHDGTGSHLLEEVLQYNTLIGQQFQYTRSQGVDAGRAEYEGQQQNDSCDTNLYWALAGGLSWSGATVVAPPIARNVQFVAPLHTKLYDTEQYIPCNALGGVRLELQLDNYLRSIEYTTGSLGIGASNALPTYPLSIIPNAFELPAEPTLVQPAVPMFQYTGGGAVVGTGYLQGNIYTFTGSIAGSVGGFILAKTTVGGVGGRQ